jgi:hypothetical protein
MGFPPRRKTSNIQKTGRSEVPVWSEPLLENMIAAERHSNSVVTKFGRTFHGEDLNSSGSR